MAKMTWKSSDEFLDDLKESKKSELRDECHNAIIGSFESYLDGKKYEFTYDLEAQTNMQETYNMFQNNVIDEIKWTTSIDGKKKRVNFSKRDFEKVYYDGVKHKQTQISKLKDVLEPMVDSAESESELDEITWDKEEIDEAMEYNINETIDRSINDLKMGREMSDMALMEFVGMMSGL